MTGKDESARSTGAVTILVVENEAIIGMHIRKALDGFGFIVPEVARNAADALSSANELRPELILMDIALPGGMDGIDAAKIVHDTLGIPVVFMTGNADVATVQRARETNPYGYVLKPVNVQHLFSTIDTALNRHRLERKLKESEERFRRLTDNMTDMVSQVDGVGTLVYVSPSHKKILGYDPEALCGQNVFDRVHPDDQAYIMEEFERVRDLDSFTRGTYRYRHADGHYIWIETDGKFLHDAGGRFEGAIFASRDVTDRVAAEEALRQSEAKFRYHTEMMSDIIWTMDLAMKMTYVSPSVERILGYSARQVVGRSLGGILTDDSRSMTRSLFEDQMRLEASGTADPDRTVTANVEYRHRNGSIVVMENIMRAIRDRDGRITGVFGVSRDVTERLKAGEALRESEEKFFKAFHRSPLAMTISMLPDSIFLDVNEEFLRKSGREREEVIGRPAPELNLWKNNDLRDAFFAKLIREGAVHNESVELVSKKGIVSNFLLTGETMKIGGRDCILFSGYDVTDLVRAEKELRANEQRFSAVFHQSGVGIFLFDRDLILTESNRQFVKILRSTPVKVIGLDLKNLREKAVTPVLREAINGRVSTYEGIYHVTTSDAVIYVNFTASPLHDRAGSVIGGIGVVLDITDRKKIEMELQKSEERYRELFDNAYDLIFTVDMDERLLSVNKIGLKLTGHTAEEAKDLHVSDLVAPEYMEMVHNRKMLKTVDGLPTTYEVELMTRDGGRIPMEVSTRLVVMDGKPYGIQGIGRNITERKRMMERITAALREKEILLREVHHRVKNNFQVITSLLNLQSSKLHDPELLNQFNDAQYRIRSMALVHEKLYQSEDISQIDFSSYLRSITEELYGSYVDIRRRPQLTIEADDIHLNVDQAIPCGLIMNEILTNIFKYAFPEGWAGDPQIRIQLREGAAGRVAFEVGDNGVGIPEGVEPGTTDTLGLTLISILARQLEGEIKLDRSRGTCYILSFTKK